MLAYLTKNHVLLLNDYFLLMKLIHVKSGKHQQSQVWFFQILKIKLMVKTAEM